MADKIWCGKAKEVTNNYGTYYRLNLCLSDIPEEHITTLNNGQRYVNLEMGMMKQRDKKENTHALSVNTWKPDNAQGGAKQPKQAQPKRQEVRQPEFAGPEDFEEDIPL